MSLLARLSYELKTIVGRHDAIALPILRLRGHGEVLSGDTEIVIESFPRSASSFAVAAFRLAQEPHASRIAHHTHAPAQILAAARRSVPALVLIRPPEDAVLSHVIFKPDLTLPTSLRGYVRFHEPLLMHRDGFVVGTFDEVTRDFGGVIERVNARFGTAFRRFEHTPEHGERIHWEIRAHFRSKASSAAELDRTIALPSEQRAAVKEHLRAAYRAAPPALRRRAERAFEALLPSPGS